VNETWFFGIIYVSNALINQQNKPYSMFILRDLLVALQAPFSDSKLGRERSLWFVFTLLAVIFPFTSSMSSNLLRSLQTLFGLDVGRRRFYTFMASAKMPWQSL
jgi:hypothetical protein